MNAPTALAEGLPRRRFTVADVVRMVEVGLIGEDERLEVLDGEIVPMSPKGNRHELIKVALNLLWGRFRPEGFAFAPETGLYLSDTTYLEPDFIVFSRTVRKADVKGPDVLLAVEVADLSLGYDLGRKPRIYALHGVRELWVIDAPKRVAHLHSGLEGEGYARVETRSDHQHVEGQVVANDIEREQLHADRRRDDQPDRRDGFRASDPGLRARSLLVRARRPGRLLTPKRLLRRARVAF